MKKIILIFFILVPCLVISQYNRKYKNPPKLTNGIIMTIGGVSLTTMGFLVRPLYYTNPSVKKPWYKQNHKWPAITVGVTFTITGLITMLGEK